MKKDDIPNLAEQLEYLRSAKDEDIDFSDIPEIRDFSHAIRGRFYRPLKEYINIGIDADILAWFKSRNPEYQTAINQALRDYMLARVSAATD